MSQRDGHIRRPRPDANEIDEMVARYATGETVSQIAVAMGRNRNTVARHLQSRGVEIAVGGSPNHFTMAEAGEMKRLHRSGATTTFLASLFGCSRWTVSRYLNLSAGLE